MPVPLASPDDDDVARSDEPSLLLGCDDSFALDDVEGLFGCVKVGPRSRGRLEEHHDHIDPAWLRCLVQALLTDRAAEILGILRRVGFFRP
jgi:hypothetical protein